MATPAAHLTMYQDWINRFRLYNVKLADGVHNLRYELSAQDCPLLVYSALAIVCQCLATALIVHSCEPLPTLPNWDIGEYELLIYNNADDSLVAAGSMTVRKPNE